MTEKLKKFLVSDEFFGLVDKLDEILNIDPNQDFERDSKVVVFLDTYFREKLEGENLINYLKTNLDWLTEEDLKKVLDFIQENLVSKREELWREEPEQKEVEFKEESLEEKERRYLEAMKEILKTPIDTEKRTFTFEPIFKKEQTEDKFTPFKQEKKLEQFKLPEETIIIRHKEDEEEKDDQTIDISKI